MLPTRWPGEPGVRTTAPRDDPACKPASKHGWCGRKPPPAAAPCHRSFPAPRPQRFVGARLGGNGQAGGWNRNGAVQRCGPAGRRRGEGVSSAPRRHLRPLVCTVAAGAHPDLGRQTQRRQPRLLPALLPACARCHRRAQRGSVGEVRAAEGALLLAAALQLCTRLQLSRWRRAAAAREPPPCGDGRGARRCQRGAPCRPRSRAPFARLSNCRCPLTRTSWCRLPAQDLVKLQDYLVGARRSHGWGRRALPLPSRAAALPTKGTD